MYIVEKKVKANKEEYGKDYIIVIENLNDLQDIRDVVIDQTESKEKRMKSFIKQIKNPYMYKCGDIVVKTSFADTNISLEERLVQHFKSMS